MKICGSLKGMVNGHTPIFDFSLCPLKEKGVLNTSETRISWFGNLFVSILRCPLKARLLRTKVSMIMTLAPQRVLFMLFTNPPFLLRTFPSSLPSETPTAERANEIDR